MPAASIEEALQTDLLANLSEIFATRIYLDLHDQGANRPYLVIKNLTGQRHGNLIQASGAATDRIQLECVGDTTSQAGAARAAVNARLETYIASIPATVDGVEIDGVEHELNYSRVDVRQDNRNTKTRFHRSTDWQVSYQIP